MRRRGIRQEGVATFYVVMRKVCRVFALFIVFIVGVVAWRKLIIEGLAITDLERGELISLGILLFIALLIWLVANRIGREIPRSKA